MKKKCIFKHKHHFTEQFPLYHLSEKNYDGQTFSPRSMDKDRVMEGENWKTKRICVSKSIDGAISALCDSMSMPYGLQLYVHIPINLDDLFLRNKVYQPSTKQVPDAVVTDEFWLKDDTIWKCIGKIEVGHVRDDIDLTYELDGDILSMDRFEWKWISQNV